MDSTPSFPPRSTSLKMSSNAANIDMWLFLLPYDTLRRIALYLSGGKPTCSLLFLAELSGQHRESVLSILSNKLNNLCFDGWEHTCVKSAQNEVRVKDVFEEWEHLHYRWVTVMNGGIVETDKLFKGIDRVSNLRCLSVRKGKSLNTFCDLACERGVFPTLRHLHLHLRSPLDSCVLLHALSYLNLTYLGLEGFISNSVLNNEDSRNMILIGRPGRKLSDVCPLLTMLDLTYEGISSRAPLEEVLPSFPKLRWLGLRNFGLAHVSERFFAWMGSLECVDLSVSKLSDLALNVSQIGTSVKAISNMSVMCNMDLHRLVMLDLRELDLTVENGFEREFVHHIGGLQGLRILSLQWHLTNDRFAFRKLRMDACSFSYSSLLPRALVQIVQGLPLLNGLRLDKVRVYADELDEVLRHLGSRLETFSCAVEGQRDHMVGRLESILDWVFRYCPNVQSLDIGKWSCKYSSRIRCNYCMQKASAVLAWIERLKLERPLMEISRVLSFARTIRFAPDDD